MPVAVKCRCGRSYNLKDEFAGKLVQCPHCAEHIAVPAIEAELAPVQPQADPAFDRDSFLLRQKHLAISEKYVVWDEQGRPILFIERPAHLGRGLLAVFGGLLAGLVVGAALGILSALAPHEALKDLLLFAAIGGAIATLLVVFIVLIPKRHVTFYRDENKRERLLEILQDQKVQIIVGTYTVRDASGAPLARLRKNYLHNIIRRRWQCFAPDGSLLCMAMEDSIILSLLRRLLGPMFGVLRTNFIITAGDAKQVIGEFNRKFTILDRYVLDLKADRQRSLDRRIALALGVMLDTGEKR